MDSVPLPPDLQTVPYETLKAYARECTRQCLTSFTKRFHNLLTEKGVDSSLVERIAAETLDNLFGSIQPEFGFQTGNVSQVQDLRLVFGHDCKNIGCPVTTCLLCANNQNRRCKNGLNFSPKYIKNDLLRARCDAPIRIELVDGYTGKIVDKNLQVTLTIIDGNDYAKKLDSGADQDTAVQQAVRVYTNGKGDALLIPGIGGSHDEEKQVVIPLNSGVAYLPDLRVSDSSEALRGRGATFRLVARPLPCVVDGVPVKYVLSDVFQVLSNRSKPNCKPAIPHIEDPVKNLEAIGDATVPKLERLKEAAKEMGFDLANVPFEVVTKVGEFRELAKLASTDRNLQDKLRKVLSLTKDQWKMAHEHAMKAVEPDHRLRIWYPDKHDTNCGLVFECVQGNVLLEKPVGVLTHDGLKLEAHLGSDPAERQRIKQQMDQLLPAARKEWYRDGHGNWAIYLLPEEAQALALGNFGAIAMQSERELPRSIPENNMMNYNASYLPTPEYGQPTGGDYMRRVGNGSPHPFKMLRAQNDTSGFEFTATAPQARPTTSGYAPQARPTTSGFGPQARPTNSGFGPQARPTNSGFGPQIRPVSSSSFQPAEPGGGFQAAHSGPPPLATSPPFNSNMYHPDPHANPALEEHNMETEVESNIRQHTPEMYHWNKQADSPTPFENTSEQFTAMLSDILNQQPDLAGGEGGDMKRKPSRALSELFLSMSLQAPGMGGSSEGFPSMPTSNVMDILKTMMSLEPQRTAGGVMQMEQHAGGLGYGQQGQQHGHEQQPTFNQQFFQTLISNDNGDARNMIQQLLHEQGCGDMEDLKALGLDASFSFPRE